MKPAELREKPLEELLELLHTTSRELWKTRFQNFTSQLDDTAKIRRLRRDVARIKTLLTEQSRKAEGQ